MFALLHSIFFAFFPLKRFRGTSPSFVLEEAFWLMLGTVLRCFILFSSLLPPPSGFRVLEFLQGWSWGWPELSEPGAEVGIQPNPNPDLRSWSGVSSDSGTRSWVGVELQPQPRVRSWGWG